MQILVKRLSFSHCTGAASARLCSDRSCARNNAYWLRSRLVCQQYYKIRAIFGIVWLKVAFNWLTLPWAHQTLAKCTHT